MIYDKQNDPVTQEELDKANEEASKLIDLYNDKVNALDSGEGPYELELHEISSLFLAGLVLHRIFSEFPEAAKFAQTLTMGD